MGTVPAALSVSSAKDAVVENMVANVEAKYDAELKLDKNFRNTFEGWAELGEPHDYTLVFRDGVSAEYKMYFKKSGEPVVVDDSAAPTPSDLEEKSKK